MSSIYSSDRDFDKDAKPPVAGRVIALGAMAGLALLMAYLAVTHNWRVGAALVLLPIVVIVMHRYPFITMTVWLLLDPFLLTSTTPSERAVYWVIHRALPPATIIVILLSSLLGMNKRTLPKVGWPELGMLGYVIASLFSIVYWNRTPLATTYLFYDRVISPMCLYLVVRLSVPSEEDMRRLMPAVLFLGVSQSVIGILSWFDPQLLPSTWLEFAGLRTTGSLVNTTVYSTTLVFAGLLVLHYGLSHKRVVVRNIFVSAFLLILFCVLISFSRASWLGIGVVLLGVAYLYPKFVGRVAVLGLFVAALFGGFLLTRLDWAVRWANERLYSQEAQTSAFSRVPVALAAVGMFEAKPILGWGYGNFDRFAPLFQGQIDIGNVVGDDRLHASHNFYLSLLAEQGLVGFLLFLSPIIYWLIRTSRVLRKMPSDGFWSRKLVLVLWLVLLNEVILINFANLRVVFGWGLWWVVLGFLANVIHTEEIAEKQSPSVAAPALTGRA